MRTIKKILAYVLCSCCDAWKSLLCYYGCKLKRHRLFVFEVVIVVIGTAEIMLHGYMPTPATTLKLQVPRFYYVCTVIVKEKHRQEMSVLNLKHVMTKTNFLVQNTAIKSSLTSEGTTPFDNSLQSTDSIPEMFVSSSTNFILHLQTC